MKEIVVVCALIALFNPLSLIYAQCFLVSQLLGGNKSPVEMVRIQPEKAFLQAQQVTRPTPSPLNDPLD